MLDLPSELIGRSDTFWSRALDWKIGQTWRDYPEFHHLDPPDGHSHALVQVIDGPPRLHLDLYAADDVDHVADWIARQGATLGERHAHWQVMTSPTGFPFCVVSSDGERDRPGARAWPGGHRSRLVQVCLDVPHGQIDEEAAFWGARSPAGRSSHRATRSSPAISSQARAAAFSRRSRSSAPTTRRRLRAPTSIWD